MDVTREEDHAPGIKPVGRIQAQGQCRYCGQYMYVYAPASADQKMLNSIAERQCHCEQGEGFRNMEYERNAVQKKIEQHFPEESQLKTLVDACSDAVMKFVAKKVTIITTDKNNARITYNITRKNGGTEIKKVTQEEDLL